MSDATPKTKTLSLRLPAGKGLYARIHERPGLSLPSDKLSQLRDDLRAIAQAVLPDAPLDYGVFSDTTDALDKSFVTIIYEKDTHRPVAFNALPFLDISVHGKTETILHLGLLMVDPATRSKGLSSMLYGFSCVILFIKGQLRPLWISSVTQVPAVVGLISELFSTPYPAPPPARASFRHRQIARQIMAHHRQTFGVGAEADFDEDLFIIRNAYTGGSDNLKKTFEQAPKHRKDVYNEMCKQQLDYGRGDDYLQIGVLDMVAVRRYLLKMIPEGQLAGVLSAFTFFIFKVAFLPALYWFDNRKSWGALRPWK